MDKTQMIQQNTAKPPGAETVRQSAARVVQDVMALAELQGQLFKSDTREIAERIARPVIVFAAGSLLFLATLPVCLLAIAQGLIAAGVPQAAAYASVAAASMVVAVAMATWAARRLRRVPPAFARSREELTQNIVWIKGAVRDMAVRPEHPGSGPHNSREY
jgi:hypothetical protein